ncbi:glutathione S-transferase family protein [Xylophilus sp. GOD-11R]|uniref:glutathione S-transferase family protein n=1 Tax=Xylophilus sp. GOD-11R TaxID=3089814 RepID=UPI00298C55E3|nr:glutathione S-transferase family protein [Xylophilus sp. GOD-11R]WPB56878.1 glutathione S-transferase family protein [Xylophilus sp. GOD-11R]
MLILRSSPFSPFGRKVRIAAEVAGLSDRITVLAADTNSAEDSIRTQNPLGKIPALILEDGEALFDSRVIVEYFHDMAPEAGLFPPGPQRFAVLRQQALADGLMDAALLQVYEARYRPAEHHVQSWLDYQNGKTDRALAFAAERYTLPKTGTPDAGEIALACALGYLDLRFAGTWRQRHPALVDWLAAFADRTPAFAETAPPTA